MNLSRAMRSAIPVSALALLALAAPALGEIEPIAMESPGWFVFRVGPDGSAVCGFEQGFMPVSTGLNDAGAELDSLFCRLYIDGVLQPPYPGYPGEKIGPTRSGSAAAAIPAPGAIPVLFMGAGVAARRRRRTGWVPPLVGTE